MSDLAGLAPREKLRVMDLVSAAGVDVSAWGDYARGPEWAAANPKYCYEWSFVQPNKVVVLNLWYDNMQERGGAVVQDLNLRELARDFERVARKGVWIKRAIEMDFAVQKAFREKLPVRVIVCDGRMRDLNESDAASRVEKRLLDPVPWAVTAYDSSTGGCTLTRGGTYTAYVDQFVFRETDGPAPERRTISGQAFIRSPEVRRRVLIRAQGRCEYCQAPGFITASGEVFLETHHVIPLSEGGPDTVQNVVALCPNHHREAHHGRDAVRLREELLQIAARPITPGCGSVTSHQNLP